jgi:hypothetical protein
VIGDNAVRELIQKRFKRKLKYSPKLLPQMVLVRIEILGLRAWTPLHAPGAGAGSSPSFFLFF